MKISFFLISLSPVSSGLKKTYAINSRPSQTCYILVSEWKWRAIKNLKRGVRSQAAIILCSAWRLEVTQNQTFVLYSWNIIQIQPTCLLQNLSYINSLTLVAVANLQDTLNDWIAVGMNLLLYPSKYFEIPCVILLFREVNLSHSRRRIRQGTCKCWLLFM